MSKRLEIFDSLQSLQTRAESLRGDKDIWNVSKFKVTFSDGTVFQLAIVKSLEDARRWAGTEWEAIHYFSEPSEEAVEYLNSLVRRVSCAAV